MLDHPEEMWQNYYRYYRRRMAPKVDVRLVLIVTITVVSAIQVRIDGTRILVGLRHEGGKMKRGGGGPRIGI